jgi:hypothetical protein
MTVSKNVYNIKTAVAIWWQQPFPIAKRMTLLLQVSWPLFWMPECVKW